MSRRRFLGTAITGAAAMVAHPAASAAAAREAEPKYRGGIVGLGWMGLLYDLADRIPNRFEVEDKVRPTPKLDIHRKFNHHDHPGNEGNPTSYAEALWARPEVKLVSAAEFDPQRLKAFKERYGNVELYDDALKMYATARLDIVAIATNTKGRSFLTIEAVKAGAKGIFVEKPMSHTLEEADRMVQACAERNVPLNAGSITTTHPSFAKAKELLEGGEIGELLSIEAAGPFAQHQNWAYFLRGKPAWVTGHGDEPRRESGSDEFRGQGMMVTTEDEVVHFRKGAPGVRLYGSKGEIRFGFKRAWELDIDMETPTGKKRIPAPWPEPQFLPPYGGIYCLDDVIACMEGRLDEPKNSGRRVAMALETEIALKESAKRGGQKVDLPLEDRSLGLNYDWFR